MPLTLERLREVLNYDPETGHFTWLVSMPPRGRVGARAGTIQKNGYRGIAINGFRATAHRLAWFYVYGKWPERDLDHVNCVRDDNRIANLREATESQNLANISAHKDSTTGLKGVSKKRDKWQARIFCRGVKYNLGCYESPSAAHAAYAAKAKELFGEFARAA